MLIKNPSEIGKFVIYAVVYPDLPSFLQGLLARLGISKPDDTEKEPEHEQVLDEVTFEGIAKYIQTEKCTKYGNNQ